MATAPNLPEQPNQPDEQGVEARLHAVEGHLTDQQKQRRPRYGQPFFPAAIAGSSIYILATVIALIALSVIHPADSFSTDPNNPGVIPADPLNHTQYNPRPEWYFLFLFQILKYFQGPWELVGTVVIPGLLGAVLIGLPFYDRNWSRRAVKRPIAVTSAGLGLLAVAVLTFIPIQGAAALQGSASSYLAAPVAHPKWANIQAIFAHDCKGCHVGASGGNYFAGLNLESYQSTMKGGQKGVNGGVITGSVIKPGNALASYMWQVVEWRQDLYKVGANMPLGATAKIPEADRTNIKNWINDGARNAQNAGPN